MTPSTAKLLPALLVPFFAWRVYRRFQRNVGQQPLRPQRLITGLVVFGLLSFGVIAATIAVPKVLAGFGAGLVIGLGLAFVGLRLTHFQTTAAGHFYTPNTYIGVGLSLLLAGRVIYRYGVLFISDVDVTQTSPRAALLQSSLTLFILGLTAGYYLTYNTGVLMRGERQKPGQIS